MSLHVLTPDSAFAHVGTSQELLDVLCRPSLFREGLGLHALSQSVGASSEDDGVRGVLLNSLVACGASSLIAGSLVEHSRLSSLDVVGANCVVSGVRGLTPDTEYRLIPYSSRHSYVTGASSAL